MYSNFLYWCKTLILFCPFPGLQDVLPEFLRGRFVEAALSYVACNSEGELRCRNNDCWCHCSPRFPQCNCPFIDIKVMEENLEKSNQAWSSLNHEFMESGKVAVLAVWFFWSSMCICFKLHQHHIFVHFNEGLFNPLGITRLSVQCPLSTLQMWNRLLFMLNSYLSEDRNKEGL